MGGIIMNMLPESTRCALDTAITAGIIMIRLWQQVFKQRHKLPACATGGWVTWCKGYMVQWLQVVDLFLT